MVLELVGHQKRSVSPSDTIVKLSLNDPENRAGKCPKIDLLVEVNGCNGYSWALTCLGWWKRTVVTVIPGH